MNLTYKIAHENVSYRRAYKEYCKNKNINIDNIQNDYLINISNILNQYKSNFDIKDIKYNEYEKIITVSYENKKLFITTEKLFLLFKYDNKKYIVKDCYVFLELLRIFKKYNIN